MTQDVWPLHYVSMLLIQNARVWVNESRWTCIQWNASCTWYSLSYRLPLTLLLLFLCVSYYCVYGWTHIHAPCVPEWKTYTLYPIHLTCSKTYYAIQLHTCSVSSSTKQTFVVMIRVDSLLFGPSCMKMPSLAAISRMPWLISSALIRQFRSHPEGTLHE